MDTNSRDSLKFQTATITRVSLPALEALRYSHHHDLLLERRVLGPV